MKEKRKGKSKWKKNKKMGNQMSAAERTIYLVVYKASRNYPPMPLKNK